MLSDWELLLLEQSGIWQYFRYHAHTEHLTRDNEDALGKSPTDRKIFWILSFPRLWVRPSFQSTQALKPAQQQD